jgi:Cu/Ag efflux pump CusA
VSAAGDPDQPDRHPLSLLTAVLFMSAMGATINTMTLGGMAIALGALVDDAIIVVENIVRRLRERRALPKGERRRRSPPSSRRPGRSRAPSSSPP